MKIRKNILFLVETYPSGGSDKVVRILSDKYSQKFDVHILVNKDNDLKFFKNLKKNISLTRYKLPYITALLNFNKSFLIKKILYFTYLTVKYFIFIFAIFYFCRQILKSNSKYIISNNGNYPGGDYNRAILIAASILKKKSIHLIHGEPRITKKFKYLLPELIIDQIINKNSLNFADSKETRKKVKLYTRIKNINFIYNGIKKRSIKNYQVTSKVKFISIGDFNAIKNQKFLIYIFNELINIHHLNFELIIIGQIKDKIYFKEVEELINKFNLKTKIRLFSFKRNIFKFLYQSDIYIHSSKSESFPFVILEAMSVGLPVISTNVGGVKEQIKHNINGLLYTLNNKNEAIKMILLLKSHKKIKKFGVKSKEIFDNKFSEESMFNEYDKILT